VCFVALLSALPQIQLALCTVRIVAQRRGGEIVNFEFLGIGLGFLRQTQILLIFLLVQFSHKTELPFTMHQVLKPLSCINVSVGIIVSSVVMQLAIFESSLVF